MLRTIKFVLNHPFTKGKRLAALYRTFKWQLTSRLNKKPRVFNFTQNSKLWVWKGLTGATGNIYTGLHDFEDMAFLLHFLRKGDLFVDIGANIGSYTVLASAEAGACTIAAEPILQTFNHLRQNISLNQIESKVTALNIGVGSNPGKLYFTQTHDTGNHVATANDTGTTEINIDTLDNILGTKIPALLKIDVEGFETEVLAGAQKTLQHNDLKAIIIELNGSGNKYGFNDADIHALLISNSFKVMCYHPFTRKLKASVLNAEHNTLYVRDIEFIEQRLKSAPIILIQNRPL